MDSKQSSSPPTPSSVDMKEEKLNDNQKLIWTDTTEKLLVRWGDHASCHQWLHDQSHRKFKEKNYRFSIPIIILSTITGTLNVGMQSLVPSEFMNLATIGVGTVNIFVGIITTLQNFFQYAQLSEAHFNSSVGWSKLARNIVIELSIDRKFRKDADRFISQCRADYDRLLEQSPSIPSDIIGLFKQKFKKTDLILPDILDNLTHITVYKPDDYFIPVGELKEIKDAVLNEVPGTISETLRLDPIHEIVESTPVGNFTPNPLYDKHRKPSDPAHFVVNVKDNRIKWETRPQQRRNSEIVRPPPKEDRNRAKTVVDCPTVNVKDLIAKFAPINPLNGSNLDNSKPTDDSEKQTINTIHTSEVILTPRTTDELVPTTPTLLDLDNTDTTQTEKIPALQTIVENADSSTQDPNPNFALSAGTIKSDVFKFQI